MLPLLSECSKKQFLLSVCTGFGTVTSCSMVCRLLGDLLCTYRPKVPVWLGLDFELCALIDTSAGSCPSVVYLMLVLYGSNLGMEERRGGVRTRLGLMCRVDWQLMLIVEPL